MALSGEIHTNT